METVSIALTLLNVVLWSMVIQEIKTGGIERMRVKFLKAQRKQTLDRAYYKAIEEHQENFLRHEAKVMHRKLVLC
jgi:hypothetical protein